MIANSIRRYQNLAAFVSVPVIDDARFKHNIMHARRTGNIFSNDVRKIYQPAECLHIDSLIGTLKHKSIVYGYITPRIFLRLQFLIISICNRSFAIVCSRITGIKNHHLGEPAVRCSPMPMPDTGSALDHIPFSDDLSRTAFFLIIANTSCHKDDHTTMAVPVASCPRLKCHMVRLWKVIYFIFSNHGGQIYSSRESSGDINCISYRKG